MEEIKFAEMLYTLLTGTIIPIVILWLQKLEWPGIYKFGLAVALSVVAATLKAFVEGSLGTASLLTDVATIFTVSQAIYQALFKTLDLHAALYPEAVVISRTKAQVAKGLTEVLDKETAYKLLDENAPELLDVSIELTTSEG